MSRWSAAPCRRLGLVLALLIAAGCATYSARMASVREHLAAGDFDTALEVLEERSGDKDRLLLYLNKALILHYADRWQESNAMFQAGENLAAELYTKSISEGVASLLTSDNSISYRAEPFEMAMIPYYRSLNYIYLGQRDEALVEARKASVYLQQYTDLTVAALGEEAGTLHPDVLRHNAFLQYWSAMLYEWGGETNNAFIAYRHAAAAYRHAAVMLAVETPPWLGADLRRTGRALGFRGELIQLQKDYPELFPSPRSDAPESTGMDLAGNVPVETGDAGREATPAPPDVATGEARGQPEASTAWQEEAGRGEDAGAGGEVLLLLEFGYVPQKIQTEFNLPILETDHYQDYDEWSHHVSLRMEPGWAAPAGTKIKYWLRVATPLLVDDPPPVQTARVSVGTGRDHAWVVPVEDIAGRAQANFDAKAGAITMKTIARALVKYAASQEAEKVDGTVGSLVNLFGAATETADTRSWLGLPHSIGMARWNLAPGDYELQVELVGPRGETVTRETIPHVTVRQGDWIFFSRRVF